MASQPPLSLPLRILRQILQPIGIWKPPAPDRVLPGMLVFISADGHLHRALFLGGLAVRRLRIAWRVALPGAGSPNWFTTRLGLSPDKRFIVVQQIEDARDALDFGVGVYATATGEPLFSATDNSHPDLTVRADDPQAPAEILREQAESDRYWQEGLIDNPTLPRPILTAIFEETTGSSLSVVGWTDGMQLVVRGQCTMRLSASSGFYEYGFVGPIAWWSRAGPDAAGRWVFHERGVGEVPERIVLLPRPDPVRDTGILFGNKVGSSEPEARQLLVDGVVQTQPAFSSGVVLFAVG